MTIEEALLQAEVISDDENWVRIEKYPYKSFYEDEEETFIDLEKREISDPSKNVSTLGENNSQLITFIMDRYADGVDLVDMLIQIQYKLQSGEEATAGPVNVYASDDKIKFGWAISNIQTQSVQTIQFIVYCTGKLADGESYLLKTKPMSYRIESTLGTGGYVEKPDEDWFLQFENVMNEKMNQVATLTDSTIESASGAKKSEENAAQSASTVQTLAGQVQSNTDQAKASADAAKVSEQNAKKSEDAARVYAGNASAVANVQIGTSDTAGLLRGGDIHVDESGALIPITTTDSTTLSNSHAGRVKINEIVGGMEQGENPSTDNPQPINGSVISKIRVHNGASDSFYQSKEISLSQPITLYNDILSPQNVERKFGTITLNGNEGWIRKSTSAGNYYFYTKTLTNHLGNGTCKSDCFKGVEQGGLDSANNVVKLGGTESMQIRCDSCTTVEEFVALLAEKTPFVVYELAESVIEELPTVDKIALNSLPTFNGVTYVEFIDVGVQPSVSLDYGTSKVGAKALEAYCDAQIAQLAEGAEGIEDLRAEIASVSDEVDAVEEQLSNKVLPQYRNYLFPAEGWYRVAELYSASVSQVQGALPYVLDLQINRSYANTPPESHRITIASNYSPTVGATVKFVGEISIVVSLLIPKIRVTVDTINNKAYIELYFKYVTSGNNVVLSLSNRMTSAPREWNLINEVATKESVEGVTVLGTHEFSANKSYESEIAAVQSDIDAINSRLAHKDISSSIDVGESGCTKVAYVENGQVIVRITYPAGAKGDKRLSIDTAYAPRMTVYGSANGNASDFGRLTTSWISPEGIIFLHATDAPATDMTATFTYPLKSS